MHKFVSYMKKHYYICYTLLFLIMCILVFGIFWYNGKSFVWNDDGVPQHFLSYVYYGRYLRTILKSVLFDHTLSIPAFSMSIGYGSDILTTLSYYVIGDPICALTVFVPTRYMVYFYDFSILLRFYLSGITFSRLCLYINQKHKDKFSKTAIMIGAFIYVFCGFALIAGARHPYFMNPMIYFPLVILGVEMILNKEKPYTFVLGVFLSAISNFYFFYMIVILTVLYVIWRLVFVYHKDEIREAFCSLGKITGYSILGTAMSAIILVPTILRFLDDARIESGYIHTIFYTLEDYQQSVSGFIAVNSWHDWLCMGYAAVALLAVFLLFMTKKKYRDIKVAFISMVVMFSLPIIGQIMNGNSYACNRWIWGFSLLISYIVVIMWDRLLATTFREKLQLLLCLCVYFGLCMLMTRSRTVDFFIPMIIVVVFLCLLFLRNGKYQNILTVACISCVFINIAANAQLMYSPRFEDYISEFADNDEVLDNYNYTEANVINELTDNDDTFSRYTGSISKNNTLYTGLHSTQYYWSLSNGNITDFQQESGLNYGSPEQYTGLDSRAGLSTLANVKYYVKKNDSDSIAPYGFKNIGSGTDYNLTDFLKKKLGEDYDPSALTDEEKRSIEGEYFTKYEVYENQNDLPFGYTYSNYITRETYDTLTPIEKQEAMLQSVVLEEADSESEITPDSTSKEAHYSIGELDGVQWEDGQIIVTKENGKATLNFYGSGNAENYLYIKGLEYTGLSPLDQDTDIEWALKSTYDKNSAKYEDRFWVEPTEVDLKFSSKNTNDKTVSTSITYKTPYYTWYSDQHDFLVCLYYDEQPRQSITITFPTVGIYTYEDLKVLYQPMDNYADQVNALKVDTLENVDFHDDNAVFATNEVTGNISLDQNKYLLLTIPYSSGWTAYVDGEEQEILQANTMYMALKLDAGEHNIELKYHTPGLTVGLCISLMAFAVFILIFVFSERRNKISANKEKENLGEGDKQ